MNNYTKPIQKNQFLRKILAPLIPFTAYAVESKHTSSYTHERHIPLSQESLVNLFWGDAFVQVYALSEKKFCIRSGKSKIITTFRSPLNIV